MGGGNGGGYDPAALGDKLGGKLNSYVNQKAPVFNESMYTGMGANTQGGIDKLVSDPNNAAYGQGVTGAIDSLSKTARGDYLGGNDPYFKRNLDRNLSDTQADVMSSLGADGNLNSDLHIKTLTDALGGVRDRAYSTELDKERGLQTQAIGMLPGAFQAGQLPAQTQLGAGQIQDADAAAKQQGKFDLWDRTTNADYNRFQQMLAAFTGTQSNAGMKEEVPWWQQALGYVAGNASNAVRAF